MTSYIDCFICTYWTL